MDHIRDMVTYFNTTSNDEAGYEVVRHLLQHLATIGEQSLSDVARETHVDKSTVSRIIRRVGFKSYAGFLEEARDYTERDSSQVLSLAMPSKEEGPLAASSFGRYVEEVCRSLRDMEKTVDAGEVDELAKLIRTRDTAVFAAEHPLAMAKNLQLIMVSRGCLVLVGETEDVRARIAREATEDSVVLVLSNNGGYVDDHLRQLEGLRRRGVSMWLVTMDYRGVGTMLFDRIIRLSSSPGFSANVLPMQVFVEYLIRRLLAIDEL